MICAIYSSMFKRNYIFQMSQNFEELIETYHHSEDKKGLSIPLCNHALLILVKSCKSTKFIGSCLPSNKCQINLRVKLTTNIRVVVGSTPVGVKFCAAANCLNPLIYIYIYCTELSTLSFLRKTRMGRT